MASRLGNEANQFPWKGLLLSLIGVTVGLTVFVGVVVFSPPNYHQRDVHKGVVTVAALSDDIRDLVKTYDIPSSSQITNVVDSESTQGQIIDSSSGKTYPVPFVSQDVSISITGTVENYTITYVDTIQVFYYSGIDVILVESLK